VPLGVSRFHPAACPPADNQIVTINGSENGFHQRTLNRLTTFIDSSDILS